MRCPSKFCGTPGYNESAALHSYDLESHLSLSSATAIPPHQEYFTEKDNETPAIIAEKFGIPVAALLDVNAFRFKYKLKATSKFVEHTQVWVPKNDDGEDKAEAKEEEKQEVKDTNEPDGAKEEDDDEEEEEEEDDDEDDDDEDVEDEDEDDEDEEHEQAEQEISQVVVRPGDVRDFDLPGWGFRSKRREAGATAGVIDVYIYPPGQPKPCNSMKAVNQLIKEKNLMVGGSVVSEETVAKMWTAAKAACDAAAVPSVL